MFVLHIRVKQVVCPSGPLDSYCNNLGNSRAVVPLWITELSVQTEVTLRQPLLVNEIRHMMVFHKPTLGNMFQAKTCWHAGIQST